ncbi:hypothetical protein [Luteipulveratus mongoliensis]|uniref:Uncharacterized protein n=1 Tax=Luteipulveratus mongoliensis TaxID=571913 RepID=A0A0K1JPQ2_9MICO|nr:hypothetical protein [Luteipulveratus mongoliensis]AKU18691.1 hypothetical protein VV02_06460 [Luteipulveratus mongoliensis]
MPDVEPEPTAKPTLRPVRRAPNFAQFMITGGVIGIIVGLWIGSRGDSGGYTDTTAMGFLAVIFGSLGVLLAGAVAVILDRRSLR